MFTRVDLRRKSLFKWWLLSLDVRWDVHVECVFYLWRADNHLCQSLMSSMSQVLSNHRMSLLDKLIVNLRSRAFDSVSTMSMMTFFWAAFVHSVVMRWLMPLEMGWDMLGVGNDKLSFLEVDVFVRRNIVLVSHGEILVPVIIMITLDSILDNSGWLFLSIKHLDFFSDQLSISSHSYTSKWAASIISRFVVWSMPMIVVYRSTVSGWIKNSSLTHNIIAFVMADVRYI
jgi:hypothetical protein